MDAKENERRNRGMARSAEFIPFRLGADIYSRKQCLPPTGLPEGESVKPGPGRSVSLMLTPMQLLDRLAALIPPPRKHRHRYFGVPAPNSPLREAVTALAQPAKVAAAPTPVEPIPPQAAPAKPMHRQAARYVWALPLARIYEVPPLLCPQCGGAMKSNAAILPYIE